MAKHRATKVDKQLRIAQFVRMISHGHVNSELLEFARREEWRLGQPIHPPEEGPLRRLGRHLIFELTKRRDAEAILRVVLDEDVSAWGSAVRSLYL